MSLQYLFDPNKQFQSLGGVNEVSGFLRVFINGTDDRATTYKNFDGTLNEADIVLDTYGRAVVIVDDMKTYRLEVYNRLGGLMWTVSNYKARGGSGGSGTTVSVEGTVGEIDVDENTQGGIKHFVLSLSNTIKNAISTLGANISSIALAVNGKKDRQNPVFIESSNIKTVKTFSQDENGNISIDFDDIAFPDWTSAINSAFLLCEQKENKKTTLVGYESSNTYYPSIKAVVDFVNSALQNLGGKLITDNGNPFTSSSDLPSSTPYGGVAIADNDYAYVQGTGFAERWSATVTGSSVAWVNEYTINIPVFTPEQQAAIDSGVTAEMLGTFLTKTGDGSNVTAAFTAAGSRTNISTGEKLSVIFGKLAKWFSDLKTVAFSGSYSDLSNKPTIGSGTLTIQKNGTSVATFGANQTGNTTANIAVPTKTSELTNDSNFLTTSGNGSDVTATFTAAGSRTNIATGEKLSVIFGKVAKWFADLKTVAFSGSYSDLSNKPTIPAAAKDGVLTIKQNGTSKGTFSANQSSNTEINVTDTTYESKSAASGGTAVSLVTTGEKYNWNAKQNALPTSGTASSTYAINVSGNAATATKATAIQSQGEATGTMHPVVFDGAGAGDKFAYVMKNVTSYYDAGNGTIWIVGATGGTKERTRTGSLRLGNGAYKGQIWPDNLTADRTYQLPDAGGTFALQGGDYRTQGLQASYSSSSGYAASAGSATDSTYATKIGSSASHPNIGSQNRPVWVDSNGNVQECSDPSRWSVGTAGYADLARYVYSTEFGGCDKPTFIKTTGQTNVAELGSAFDIPHVVTRWHEELYYPSTTGFGIIHRTDKFSDPTTKPLSLSIKISTNNSSFDIRLDGSSLTPWYGGQVWGTIKWDSQSGSNLNSAITRIGISNIADSSTILATRNISTSNQQDIQGHALFAICTGDLLHRYVVDMEISLIKPQAGSSVSYVSVVSKCYTVSPLV